MEPQVKGIERVKCTSGRAERVKMRGSCVCERDSSCVCVHNGQD